MKLVSHLPAAAFVLVGSLAALPPAVAAQDASSPHMDTGVAKMNNSADMTFAIKAAQSGLAEVQLGKLAADKASSPDVKAFGQRMVDDHTKANDQLKGVAQQKNMTVPATMDAKDQAVYDKLSNASGAQFDKDYMKAMVKDHEEDIKAFQKESTKGKDPDLKGFATQTLPILQQHLQMAKETEGKVSGS